MHDYSTRMQSKAAGLRALADRLPPTDHETFGLRGAAAMAADTLVSSSRQIHNILVDQSRTEAARALKASALAKSAATKALARLQAAREGYLSDAESARATMASVLRPKDQMAELRRQELRRALAAMDSGDRLAAIENARQTADLGVLEAIADAHPLLVPGVPPDIQSMARDALHQVFCPDAVKTLQAATEAAQTAAVAEAAVTDWQAVIESFPGLEEHRARRAAADSEAA